MGIGDILDGGARIAASLAPANLAASALLNATGNGDNPQASPRVEGPTKLMGALTPTKLPAALYLSMGHLPVVEQVFQVLDAPRRAIDTALISSQHYASTRVGKQGTDWAEFLNRSTWAKAWDLASFENATAVDPFGMSGGGGAEGLPRTTGGQVVFGRLFSGDDSLDPFDAEDARQLQAEANGSWYGRTMTAAMDLGETFLAVPGTGALARGRAAGGLRGAAIEDVDAVATRFNEVGVADRSLAKKAADKTKDVLHLSVNSGAQNVDALVARQVEGLRIFDGNLDEFQVQNQLKARMEHAPDGEVAKLANVFTEINRRVVDPAARERLRTNAFLAAMGSGVAKKAFITESPLLAKNFEGLTTVPREASAFTELYSSRITKDGDLPLNDIVENVWKTASDRAEIARLEEHILTLKTADREHARLVADLKAMKPKVQGTPEAEHLRSARAAKRDEVRKLEQELRTAQQDLHGAKRWAAGAAKKAQGVGATDDVVDFNQSIGDARRRVEDVQSRLKAARSDRDLLDSTPMHDPAALDDWRSMVDEARLERAGIGSQLDLAKALRNEHQTALAAKEAEIRKVSPYLDRANRRVSEILDIAGKDSEMALVGDAKPTLLNRLKANMREQLGAEHMVTVGDGNTMVRLRSLPSIKARRALAPQARGSIALNELSLGVRQLDDTLARSKVFTPEEIAAWRNQLIEMDAGSRAGVVARAQDEMYKRVVVDWARRNMPELTAEEAVRHAEDIAALQRKAWGQGNHWVTKSADEQLTNDVVLIRDIDGEYVGYDGASLRSQLADHAPILDPWHITQQLDRHGGHIKANIRNGLRATANAHDLAVSIWKVSALLRPGLYVRSMLDTGPRALASMSAAETMAASMNGVVNMTRNSGLRGLAKLRLAGSPDEVAARLRYSGTRVVSAGGREFRFAADNLDLASKMQAATKGNTVANMLHHDMGKAYDDIAVDRSSWKRRRADHAMWHDGYAEYASMLLASPTARKLADMMTKVDDAADIARIREEIKASPEFTREYRNLAQHGMSRSEWLNQLVHEVDLMFPSEKLLNAAKAGGLNKKLIDREIPRSSRFDVPSPEASVMEGKAAAIKANKVINKAFKHLLDNPDMWLARMPVMTQVYKRRVQMEVAALAKSRGRDYRMTDREWEMIDKRSRNAAIGYVRHTFFDTTRYTGAHRALARFSPFIAAWEDAMISWGRLIYDDPRRLTKLSAAYHAPFTVASSQNMNLVVDRDGNPITRGDNPDGVFVAVPAPVARVIAKAAGQDPRGVGQYRMRIDAINSIAQGETWWLPGVGPTVAMPATWALGSGKVVSREAALDLADTDSPMGRAILKSVFLGGEIPPGDAGSVAASAVPSTLRIAFTEFFGQGKARTQTYALNQLVMEAQKRGEKLDDKKWQEITARSEKMANAAASVRLIMSGGLGLTGTATVDAQFYVDQMRIINAMPAEMRVDDQGHQLSAQEFFAKEYPDAADLDWYVTKNETGINATVNAAKSEARLAPLLKREDPSVGWMILGRDNVVPAEFSRTAYSMQKADGNRTYLKPEDAATEAQAAVGYKQLAAWKIQIQDSLVAAGWDPAKVTTSKEYRQAVALLREELVQTNNAFAKADSEFTRNSDYYYGQAKKFSSSGPLKDRSDMVAFRDYDTARQQVMDYFGIKSFSGTSPEYAQAKAVMQQVGEQIAADDLGFSQMWDKFLEREVE